MTEEEGKVSFSKQDVDKFEAFSKKADSRNKLIEMLAPSIWENNDVKLGLLCQLFGGTSKNFVE